MVGILVNLQTNVFIAVLHNTKKDQMEFLIVGTVPGPTPDDCPRVWTEKILINKIPGGQSAGDLGFKPMPKMKVGVLAVRLFLPPPC